MDKKTSRFGNLKWKHKFHQHKNLISIYDVDINKILLSNKAPLVRKVLNTFLITNFVRTFIPLWLTLSKISTYRMLFD